MKKTIALLLVLILALSACKGGGDSPAGSDTARSDSSTASLGKFTMPSGIPIQGSKKSGEESPTGITLEEGREFNAFYWAFKNAESDFDNLIRSFGDETFKDVYDHYNFTIAYDSVGRCNGYFSQLYEFDETFYQRNTAPDGTHLVGIFGGELEGSKETNGSVITALIDVTLGEDGRWSEAGEEPGDHAHLEATLDTKNLTLSYENTLERDGEIVDRTVLEVVILPDGTILFQFFHMENLYLYDSSAREYAVFKRISGDSYSSIVADIGFDFDFTYNSIIGRGDMTTEQMARSHTPLGIAHIFTVEDRHVQGDMVYGKVNYETYESPASLREFSPSKEKPGAKSSLVADVMLNPGHEFSDFYSALQDAEQTFNDFFFSYAEAIPDSNDSIDFMMAFRDILNTNFWFADFYDRPDELSGKLPFKVFRDTSGGMITTYVYDTLTDQYTVAQKGDHMSLFVTLDTKNLTLNCERVLKRGDNYLERAVTEAVMLPDGTILFQRFIVGVDEVYGEHIAVFKRISGDSYSAVIADIESDYGYTYQSIIGRGDMTAEEMARGYAVKHVFTVENGEVTYAAK